MFNGASPSADSKTDTRLPVYSHDDAFRTGGARGGGLQYCRYNDENLISNNLSPVSKLRSQGRSSGCLIFVRIFTFFWFLVFYISSNLNPSCEFSNSEVPTRPCHQKPEVRISAQKLQGAHANNLARLLCARDTVESPPGFAFCDVTSAVPTASLTVCL